MKDIVDEFVEATPIWHKALPEPYRHKPCLMCGIVPDNLLELAEALDKTP